MSSLSPATVGGIRAAGQNCVKSAGELVDVLAFDLFAGVDEEVGRAANTHSIRAMRGQLRERFQVCSAAIQLQPNEYNVVNLSKGGLEVHTLL